MRGGSRNISKPCANRLPNKRRRATFAAKKENYMKLAAICSSLFFAAVALASLPFAPPVNHPDFSGSWELNPQKSKNLGMMGQMKMTLTIEQSPTSLDVLAHATFMGQSSDSKTHYDLTGKSVQNELPMSGLHNTLSKWDGDRLSTTWVSADSAGKLVQTEVRSLSADRSTMTVEALPVSGAPVLMVFDRK
jgi:hypothetical protein